MDVLISTLYPHLDYSFNPHSGSAHIFYINDNHCEYYRAKKYNNWHKNFLVDDYYSQLAKRSLEDHISDKLKI